MTYFKQIILVLMFLTSQVQATSFVAPKKERIYSENSEYFLLVEPSLKRISVHKTDAPKSELWFFGWPVSYDTWAVANTGNTAIWVAGKYLTEDSVNRPCITVFDFAGVKRFYSCKEITEPRKYRADEVGPIGDFWRIWYESIEKKKNSILIETSQGNRVEISLESGELLKIGEK